MECLRGYSFDLDLWFVCCDFTSLCLENWGRVCAMNRHRDGKSVWNLVCMFVDLKLRRFAISVMVFYELLNWVNARTGIRDASLSLAVWSLLLLLLFFFFFFFGGKDWCDVVLVCSLYLYMKLSCLSLRVVLACKICCGLVDRTRTTFKLRLTEMLKRLITSWPCICWKIESKNGTIEWLLDRLCSPTCFFFFFFFFFWVCSVLFLWVCFQLRYCLNVVFAVWDRI